MAALGFELFFRFLWGSMLVLTFVNRRETSERFLKIVTYISLACVLCAAWLLFIASSAAKVPTGTPLSQIQNALGLDLGFLSLGLFFAGTLLYAKTVARLTRTLGFFLIFASPVFLLKNSNLATIINFLTGSLVLGAAFGGQFLGHWYLTVPGMHIRELKRVSNILFTALVLKCVESTVSLLIWSSHMHSDLIVDAMGRPIGINLGQTQNLDRLNFAHSDFGLFGDLWMGFGTFALLLLLSRVLWGIVAPFILGYMIRQTVQMRSTQSATGILYALCVAVLFGEGAAIYLRLSMGLNL